MTDASDEPPTERATDRPEDGNSDGATDGDSGGVRADDAVTTRKSVEEKYDFEDFGPRDMAEMSYDEWEAAFDPETWITGETLLDRVEADLTNRIANRDVFAVVERIEQEGEPRLVAYSDEGYAVVYPDGTVEGRGTVLRDVKPTVALASMESYDVPEMPDDDALPDPAEVPEGSGQLGNQLMQVVAAVHLLAGIALVLSGPLFGLNGQSYVIAAVAGLLFFVFGVFVFLLVANARLSDRFRAEEYRNRLRAVGLEEGERPAFLAEEGVGEPTEAERGERRVADGAEPSDADENATRNASEGGVSPASEDAN